MIQTVLGPVDEQALGYTLAHEHMLLLNAQMRLAVPEWFNEEAYFARTLPRIERLRKAGVDAVIDATPLNLGRDARILAELSRRSGLAIIASTGLYFFEDPFVRSPDPQRLAELFVREINVGMQGTDVRAGVIKCATDAQGVTPCNRAMLEAAALASRQTGKPILTHTCSADFSAKNALEQQAALLESGAAPERVVIGHCGDSNDLDYLTRILRNGTYIGLDRFGHDSFNTTEKRIETLLELLERGWEDRIVLSHDDAFYTDYWRSWQTDPCENPSAVRGMLDVPQRVLPELRRRGVTEKIIDKLMRDNVRKLFA